MPENKHLRFLLVVVYLVIGYFAITRILPNVIAVFLPFILAMLVAVITRPLVKLLRKLRVPNVLASLLSLVVVLGVVSGVIFLLVNRLVLEITLLSRQMPQFIAGLPQTFAAFGERWNRFSNAFDPMIAEQINASLQNALESLSSLLMPVTQQLLNIVKNIASYLPHTLIFTVAFLFSSIFFTKDFEYLKENIARQFPESVLLRILQVKGYAFSAFGKYLKGMGIILLITFIELLTGFLVLNVQYAFLLAFLIAVLDALPAVGTGGILIPWSVILLINGEVKMGISIFVLYVIILVVRQFIEPKIMSSSFGTYPVVTLIGMYAGLKLFGVAGLILMPITLAVLIYMQRAGLFTLWKTGAPAARKEKL